LTLTLLLDLDDTLLGNPMTSFLPAYFEALGAHLAPFIAPDRLVSHLIKSTQKMISNDLPDRTLREVFEADFFPGLGLDQAVVEPVFDEFYAQVFPTLGALTESRPEALALVEKARASGYRLAVATNPLFPRTAILERLRWAGLSAADFPFEIISDYQSFHFSKPHPAFFAEVLARMGWPAGPVVVVGDDPENDIAPARCLELATFLVAPDQGALPASDSSVHAQGRLEELLPWLDQVDQDSLVPEFQQAPSVQAVLLSTPAALHTMLAGLSPHTWVRHPADGAWALNETICHLRDVELEVHLPRIQQILASDNPYWKGIDTDAWAQERAYARQDGPSGLKAFIRARRRTLDLLRPLAPEDWQRPGRHTIFGPTDLLELAQIIAAHDRQHIRQVKRTLESALQLEGRRFPGEGDADREP
jgi:FMN phosphatase YigB (HAD superfamily)